MPRWLLPLVLVVVGLLAIGAVATLESDSSADAASAEPSLVTPLLSARRLPEALQEPAGDQRLNIGLQPVLQQSPTDTCLVVTDEGRIVVAAQPDLPVSPASNLKLLLGHAALVELGPDATYNTVVAATSAPADGVVAGDLWLIGGGDPLLATDDFLDAYEGEVPHTDMEALADRVVGTGVAQITGSVLGDETRYDTQRVVESWPSRDAGLATPGSFSALSVNRGYSDYRTDPETEQIPQPADDPAQTAVDRFAGLLEERGVQIGGGTDTGDAPDEVTEITAIESPPMSEVVQVINGFSDNTVSELVLKELGFHRSQQGTTAAGLEAFEQILSDDGLDTTGVELYDGSGLHDSNRITCDIIAEVLDDGGSGGSLATGLAVAGETGTLADRFVGSPAQGRLFAKTGTLDEATALSGFVSTLAGRDITFAYVANAPGIGDDEVAIQDLLATVLLRYPEGPTIADLQPRSVDGATTE